MFSYGLFSLRSGTVVPTADSEENITEEIESLSKKSHTHSNQSALDEITAEKIEKWDNAPEYVDNQIKNFKTEIHGNLHQHKNFSVLDSITAEYVAEWNNCVEKLSGVETILAKIVEVDV